MSKNFLIFLVENVKHKKIYKKNIKYGHFSNF